MLKKCEFLLFFFLKETVSAEKSCRCCSGWSHSDSCAPPNFLDSQKRTEVSPLLVKLSRAESISSSRGCIFKTSVSCSLSSKQSPSCPPVPSDSLRLSPCLFLFPLSPFKHHSNSSTQVLSSSSSSSSSSAPSLPPFSQRMWETLRHADCLKTQSSPLNSLYLNCK